MPSGREQVLIDAPPEALWELLGDPARYPEWAGFETVTITGEPTIEAGTEFEQTTRWPGGVRESSVFRIDELEDLRSLRMHCTKSGWYSNWLLTPAREATFVDVEFGIDPTRLQYKVFFTALGTRYFRHTTDDWLRGLRAVLARDAAAAAIRASA